MIVFTTSRFDRELAALVKSQRLTRSRMDKILTILTTNPRHPSLHLHKLTGTNNYAVSVDQNIRIILNWENDRLYLSRIGSHDEVY